MFEFTQITTNVYLICSTKQRCQSFIISMSQLTKQKQINSTQYVNSAHTAIALSFDVGELRSLTTIERAKFCGD